MFLGHNSLTDGKHLNVASNDVVTKTKFANKVPLDFNGTIVFHSKQ